MEKVLLWLSNIISSILLGDLKYKIATKDDLQKFVTRDDLQHLISPLDESLQGLNYAVQNLNHAVIEIQTVLRERGQIDCQQKIVLLQYGQAHSPLILKDEYRSYIENTGLGEQITQNTKKLLNWLQERKPKTGLDAQDAIFNLVISDEVAKYLDLTEYKEYLYQKGKTSVDAEGILILYLFEILIPQLPKRKEILPLVK